MDDPLLGPLLCFREAVESHTFTMDAFAGAVPLHMKWAVVPTADGRSWRAYKEHLNLQKNKSEWVPLDGMYATAAAAQAAVKSYVASQRPVFLDKDGEVVSVENE